MQKALGHFSIVPRRARALRFLAIPAALALLLSRVEPAAAVCNPSPTHPDLLQRVQDLGDCATGPGQLGATRSPQRRNPFSGGIYQDFENGQVVVYDRWASYLKPQMSHFVLSAVVEGNKVHVRWGDTSPFTYDYFLIRAELDDSQENLEASQKKEWTKKVSASNAGKVTFELDVDGPLRIAVEGCQSGGFLQSSTCAEGFSHPVSVDIRPLRFPVPVPPKSPPTPPQPSPGTPLMDLVTDSLVTNLQDAAAVNDFLCDASQIIDGGGNHENELKPANTIAILDYVTGGGFNCKNLPEGLQRQIRLRCRPG